MPVTFAVDKVKSGKVEKRHAATAAIDIIKHARQDQAYIKEFLCSSFGANGDSTPLANDKAIIPNTNGFIHTAIKAYNEHHHLSIRPDDIWLCILSQLSLYVTAHAEEMRTQFVSHEGSRELVVNRNGTRFDANWEGIVDEFMDQMKLHLKDPGVQAWLTPAFSTTTQTDIVAANVSVMAIMSEYFTYSANFWCGLPSVTLQGTRKDWVQLKKKAEKLLSFDRKELTRWHAVLTPIFDNFIRVFDGQVDIDGFWKHMVNYQTGSGSPTISGWIGYFAAFNKHGKWHLRGDERSDDISWTKPIWLNWTGPSSSEFWNPDMDVSSIPNGSVEVKVNIDDHGLELEGRFVAGLLGYQPGGKTVNPYVGWALYTVDTKAKEQAEERKAA